MVEVRSHLSYLFRVWPIHSHNLSEQLLKVYLQFTVHKAIRTLQNVLTPENSVLKKRNNVVEQAILQQFIN